MSEHRYRVVAERSEDWWAISVPGLSGVFSQTRRLDQVEAMAREAIALMLDVDETAIEVTVDPVLPTTTAEAVSEALSRRLHAAGSGTCAWPDPPAHLPDPRRDQQRRRGSLAARWERGGRATAAVSGGTLLAEVEQTRFCAQAGKEDLWSRSRGGVRDPT